MSLQGKRIFFIEDNVHNRMAFTMALSGSGASLVFDHWGRDPEWRLRALAGVDLVVLDLMLWRRTSGYDIFDDIRACAEYDHIPVIAVSAAEVSIALPTTRSKGFSGYIAKPIDVDLFPAQLERILAGQQVWDSGDRYRTEAGDPT
jgi:CheY-like chemotaxis protein